METRCNLSTLMGKNNIQDVFE